MTSRTPSILSSAIASGEPPASWMSLKTRERACLPSTSTPSGTNFMDLGFGVVSMDTEEMPLREEAPHCSVGCRLRRATSIVEFATALPIGSAGAESAEHRRNKAGLHPPRARLKQLAATIPDKRRVSRKRRVYNL
eukprot:CAMPEP_0183436332 /NCGR_PEP_ID=MMETSP0370-20130417/69205_1 /TAXON_ID=268820 /ORGANISM="Peridinium aciculiferum, Strain PAER-2" /LENGTH=135 /DNA_ID=CAMNT_0025623741 /DNA_START=56 /DNA_END=460 /DNA_ORIENTATION=-